MLRDSRRLSCLEKGLGGVLDDAVGYRGGARQQQHQGGHPNLSHPFPTRRRLGFCATLLALIGIVAAFVGMYLFIKLTRMAGYRADRGGGPRAPPVAAWSSPPVATHTEL